MLKRHIIGLVVLQFLLGASAVKASSADSEHIQSLKAAALESCAKGDIQIGLTSFDSAIELAQRAYGKDSLYVSDLCFSAGMAAYKTSRYRQCEDYLNQALAANPNSQEARLKLAEYYKMKGRLHDAIQLLDKTLAQDPTNLEARELLALTYIKENDQARATAQCTKLDQMISYVQSGTAYEVAPAVTAGSPEAPQLSVYPAVSPPKSFSGFTRLPPKVVAPPAQAQPPAQARPAVPIETEKGSVVEPAKKIESGKKTETKKKESSARSEHNRRAKKQPLSDDDRMSESAFNVPARLHSRALLLRGGRNRVSAESTEGDSGFAAPSRGKRNRVPRGMVPPPPPVPAMMIPAPMPRSVPPPPQLLPRPAVPGLRAATPHVDPGEEKPTPSPATKPMTPDDEGDFLLDWGGQKKKKK